MAWLNTPNTAPNTASLPDSPAVGGVREAPVHPVMSWKVPDMVAYLESLELGHLSPIVTENAIDGPLLLAMTPQDFIATGFNQIQANQITMRLLR